MMLYIANHHDGSSELVSGLILSEKKATGKTFIFSKIRVISLELYPVKYLIKYLREGYCSKVCLCDNVIVPWSLISAQRGSRAPAQGIQR